MAWDLAATSGMQTKWISRGPGRAEEILPDYAKQKKAHLNTEEACMEQGFEFQPLIFEAHAGGWCASVSALIKEIGRRQGELAAAASTDGADALVVAQRVSLCIQAENARAVLRRFPELDTPADGGSGSWGGEGEDLWEVEMSAGAEAAGGDGDESMDA